MLIECLNECSRPLCHGATAQQQVQHSGTDQSGMQESPGRPGATDTVGCGVVRP